jgi:hypothetical protein
MTYHRVWNKSNTTSVNSGAGTAYHSKAHELTDCFWWGSCFFILFCVVFSRFVILLYFYRPLCCHPFPWFAASDLPFDIWWFTLWYLLIYPLVSSDLPFDIFWFTLWYLLIYPLVSSDLNLWYLLIYPLVTSDLPFDIFWFTLWYLLIYPLVSSDLPFDIFWFTRWYLLIYPLVSSNLSVLVVNWCNHNTMETNNFYNMEPKLDSHYQTE